MSVFDQPPAAEARVDDLPPPEPPGPAPRTARSRHWRIPRRSRIRWSVALAAAAVVALATNSVTVDGDDVDTRPVETPAPAPATTTPATAPATTPATTLPVTAPPATTTAPAPSTVPPTEPPPPTSAPAASVPPESIVVPPLVDVHDATGFMVVLLPDGFETDGEPIEIDGVHLHQVSGSVDIELYLAGDLSVFGASVLDAPIGSLGGPADFAARFDPGTACQPTAVESDVATAIGDATVLGYEQCGAAGTAMVLLALDAPELQRSVFVGVQGGSLSIAATRELALTIAGSYRTS